MGTMKYADIILPLPLDGTFTYAVPDSLATQCQTGVRVVVPFGRTKVHVGIVERIHETKPTGYDVKEIRQVLDDEPIVLQSQLKLWRWISDYYMSSIGDVYKAALPAGLKAEEGYKPKTETYVRLTPQYSNEQALHIALDILKRAPKQLAMFNELLMLSEFLEQKPVTRDELLNSSHGNIATISQLVSRGMLETYEVEVGRLNSSGEPHPERIKALTAPQERAYNDILMQFMKKRVTLLHGVTSSGKTEIYIHLIQREIDKHRQVLYLLPEIALTVQIMQRLKNVFGNRLGIYHSKYSDAERVEIWKKQLSAHPYDVILGARSAVFLPFQHLGLVIVDEEHETSFKQQDPAPRYHARSAAIMLPQAPKVLLGTATPSMETFHNAQLGKFGYVALTERHAGIEMPEIQVVDIQDLKHRKMMTGPFSPTLLSHVREALANGEQAILFQNRRGYAPMIECKQCGWVPHCEHCDVSLTLHRSMNQLTCHYCGFTYRVPSECPCCGSHELQTRGYGTEKIENEILEILPEARVSRMDLDTTRSRKAYERIINDFGSGRTNLLIGTQMISKGLDFGKVSVVGILDADKMLNMPDFRAYEHAFMMMAQVSGRAGRRGKRGMVILQTHQPQLPLIKQIVDNDYRSLYHDLCIERREFHYPPFYRLVYVYMKHHQETVAESAALIISSQLRQWFGSRVLGPDKPSIAKVKSMAIRKTVLKLEPSLNIGEVRKYLAMARQQLMSDKRFSSLQIYFDIDPL